LEVTPKNRKGQEDLEPNHTHFILLDDGTYSGYEMGDYRTKLVDEISKYRNANGRNINLFDIFKLKFLFQFL
jgi:hypothetical protein